MGLNIAACIIVQHVKKNQGGLHFSHSRDFQRKNKVEVGNKIGTLWRQKINIIIFLFFYSNVFITEIKRISRKKKSITILH